MSVLKTNATPPAARPEGLAGLEATIGHVIGGVRDPEAMRRAAERMDRRRATLRETNIAVALVREPRDDA
jgi:hypothetical protein